MRHITSLIVSTIVSISAMVSLAQAGFDAGLVNVSFGNKGAAYEGKAVAGADGDKWNAPDGDRGEKIKLVDAKEKVTDVTLTFAATGTWDAEDAGFVGTNWEKLLRHYIFANEPQSIALSGLTPGAKYDVIVYSASNTDGRKTKISIGDDAKTTTYSMEKKELADGVNYAKLTASADADGTLTVKFEGVDGEGNVNGLQIMPVDKGR